jgi:poly(3-hydroxybutyrate) depolymerase
METNRVDLQNYSHDNGNRDNKGVNGKNERVRPADIKTTALFSVEGELDDISGSGQTQAVHEICSGVPNSKQKHFEAMGAGHYGIFSGKRWREHVYPHVKSFILAHNIAAQEPAEAVAAESIKQAITAVAVTKPVKTATKKIATKRITTK